MDNSSSEVEYVNIEDGGNDIIKCYITFIKQQGFHNYAYNSSQLSNQLVWGIK